MKYKITFQTGIISGAGTDAAVSIQLFGSLANSKEIQFESKLSHFEKGTKDSFFIETDKLGEIEGIKIWHNNQLLGANWYLDDISIEESTSSKNGIFQFINGLKKVTN